MSSVSIAFVGDIFLGETPCVSLSRRVADVLVAADWVIANQEAPITTSGKPVAGKICLKSQPPAAQVLKDWGVCTVSLANNHVFDYGYEGFEETLRCLNEVGISYLGAAENLAEAVKPLIVDVKGTKVGLLAHSWDEAETTCATENSYGCAPLDGEMMAKAVADLRGSVDAVIVLPHWGFCDYRVPSPSQVALGGHLLDVGATAVVGHHSHIVQGLIRRSGQLIDYSLGNFAFAPISLRGQAVKAQRDHREGVILVVHLAGGQVASHDVVFTTNRDGVIDIDDCPRRVREFQRRSSPLTARDYGRVWRRAVRWRMARRALHWLNVLNWRHVRPATLYAGWLMLREMFSGRSKAGC